MNSLSGFLSYAGSFVVALGILIAVHEFGHFWVARRLGVKVLRFSLGFGRPLLRRTGRIDGTEYVLAAIPLGGYVKMLDEREGTVAESERHRAFNRQSLWRRSAIVAAGPCSTLPLPLPSFGPCW
jgi:regulator of sigma E protease